MEKHLYGIVSKSSQSNETLAYLTFKDVIERDKQLQLKISFWEDYLILESWYWIEYFILENIVWREYLECKSVGIGDLNVNLGGEL